MQRLGVLIMAVVLASGCAMPRPYTLVPPRPVAVAGRTMKVQPVSAWNRPPEGLRDEARHESWTRNGLLLDSITFIGGIEPGEALVSQRYAAQRKVPTFWDDMSPQDLVSMIESYYRIRMGVNVFETTGVQPVTFLGQQGVQFDYSYVSSDDLRRRGRSVMSIVDRRLYLISLDGAALHYFDAALPEFEAIVGSASIIRRSRRN